MPSLLDIRRRIRSVKNTQQLTKAMKTVSAAKLRRAQERVVSARPYAEQLKQVLGNLAGRIENISHPLLEVRPEKNEFFWSSLPPIADLCGAFNSNLIRRLRRISCASIAARKFSCCTAGERARFFPPREAPISLASTSIFSRKLDYGHAKDIAQQLIELYTKAEIDAVYIVYNEFKSVIQQRIVVEKLLPLGSDGSAGNAGRTRLHFRTTAAGDFQSTSSALRRNPDLSRTCSNLLPPSTAREWPRWTPQRAMPAK